MPETLNQDAGRVIVVLGMHRSGTSLVTRGLAALGVQLGDNLASESSPDNLKGHWEDRDILELNERLMAALALQWDVVGAADEALMAVPSLEPLVEAARTLVAAKTAGNAAWAFKDPRTVRLWPFWRRVFASGVQGGPDFVWVSAASVAGCAVAGAPGRFHSLEIKSALDEPQRHSLR